MPKTKKREQKEEKKRRGLWSDEDLILALTAYKSGEKNLGECNREYGIPKPTILRYASKDDSETNGKLSMGRKPTFAPELERLLLEKIQELKDTSSKVTIMDIRRFAFIIAEDCGLPHTFNKEKRLAGLKWYQSFMQRNPQIAIDKATPVPRLKPKTVTLQDFAEGHQIKQRATWSDQDLLIAVTEYRKGEKGLNESSRAHGVPKSTIKRYADKNFTEINERQKLGRQHTFTADLEKSLVDYVLEQKELGIELSIKEIRKLAFDFAEKSGNKHSFNKEKAIAGKKWFYDFIDRHPQMPVKKANCGKKRKSKNIDRKTSTDSLALSNNDFPEFLGHVESAEYPEKLNIIDSFALDLLYQNHGGPAQTSNNYKDTNERHVKRRPPRFDPELEKVLVENIQELITSSSRLITIDDIRKFAFDTAEKYNLQHKFNKEEKMAGMKWYYNFMSRNPQISAIKAALPAKLKAERIAIKPMMEASEEEYSRTWSNDDLLLAALAYKQGQDLNECSLKYNIPEATIKSYGDMNYTDIYQRLGSEGSGLAHTNTIGLEKLLADNILEQKEHDFVMTITELQKFTFELAEKTGLKHSFDNEKKMAGKEWIDDFLQRHPHLPVKKDYYVSDENSYSDSKDTANENNFSDSDYDESEDLSEDFDDVPKEIVEKCAEPNLIEINESLTFPLELERILLEKIQELKDSSSEVTMFDIRRIAFRIAEDQKLPNSFDKENKLASLNWFQSFKQRNPQISIDKATPASRLKQKTVTLQDFVERPPRPDTKNHTSWTDQDLLIAVTEYKKGEIGLNECSRLYGVPKATIKRYADKNYTENNERNKLGRVHTFSADLEKSLVDHILQQKELGTELSIKEIRKLGFEFAEMNGNKHTFNKEKKMAGKKWFYDFTNRNPNLPVKKAKCGKAYHKGVDIKYHVDSLGNNDFPEFLGHLENGDFPEKIIDSYPLELLYQNRSVPPQTNERLVKRLPPRFDPELEKVLIDNIDKLIESSSCLTIDDIRKFAFETAEKYKLPHKFNKEEKMAGCKWYYNFMRRNPQLSAKKASIPSKLKGENTTIKRPEEENSRTWSDETVLLAVMAYKQGGQDLNECSRKYNVPEAIIQSYGDMNNTEIYERLASKLPQTNQIINTDLHKFHLPVRKVHSDLNEYSDSDSSDSEEIDLSDDFESEDLSENMYSAQKDFALNLVEQNRGVPKESVIKYADDNLIEANTSSRTGGKHKYVANLDKILVDKIKEYKQNTPTATILDIRKLAFTIAEDCKLPHKFNKQTKMAGLKWYYLFMQRNPEVKAKAINTDFKHFMEPKTKARRIPSWNPDDLLTAVTALKSGEKRLNECSRMYGIPKPTLKRYAAKNFTSADEVLPAGRPPVFATDLEKILSTNILEQYERSIILTIKEIRKLAFELAEKHEIKHIFSKKEKMAGKKWFRNFIQRNPGLPIKKFKCGGKPKAKTTVCVSAVDPVRNDKFSQFMGHVEGVDYRGNNPAGGMDFSYQSTFSSAARQDLVASAPSTSSSSSKSEQFSSVSTHPTPAIAWPPSLLYASNYDAQPPAPSDFLFVQMD